MKPETNLVLFFPSVSSFSTETSLIEDENSPKYRTTNIRDDLTINLIIKLI
ncbi:hypothetical protein M2459_002714 [Parabacteroides sp. PF5-5]|nr:hypothetical protein [Parabacteroides sp. PH5-39]MDH6316858.1 hypothetical protein [Parabacteroides sp. PF5-13]MDH6320639.1 hypothetical protein [Parabacteroides sp. PH5-13]MDH6324440.1 hypothetical protein [Parabacteroides sp. PH5-8]MDH6328043.1 hypothetical protein [Parabacteroides sp. PH5-41]MDH6335949.1 hypothetical protein [Parabacteroides sp. PF5-5]MDH6346909.1 hypothetical protein [Parabacteroides sp. PH5-46]MDH6361871.1 hypothetical protein [Parabacteroides sp. PH5-16]MDH6377539.